MWGVGGAAQADFLDIDRPHWLGVGGAPELACLVDRPALLPAPELFEVGIDPASHDLVHQIEAGEGVTGINDPPGFVRLAAIPLDIAPGQRGAAEHDRQRQALPAHANIRSGTGAPWQHHPHPDPPRSRGGKMLMIREYRRAFAG